MRWKRAATDAIDPPLPGRPPRPAMTARPNVLVLIGDDHAAHAIGAYGSVVNETPGIDRLAREGARLDACFCTNALCSPSRASILTGTYSHVNGVTSNSSSFDARQTTFASE
ncbi:MAG: sulfatase-like hydrolase/transferase, partial [Actinobacteria bacterium]|nr:sulfatase-like hydrolase/transferase [Actinomycetota bacterium]NIU69719.1 sulfatase-like hydrolase/transferase [Actinomycetota bacterium]NIW31592.1 sulfatase-like hydrolase/transferase [Actinomycetota bacterium]